LGFLRFGSGGQGTGAIPTPQPWAYAARGLVIGMLAAMKIPRKSRKTNLRIFILPS
jgi:hypothetical protein